MNWVKPQYEQKRYGFEVTMYVYSRDFSVNEMVRKTRHVQTHKKIIQSTVLSFLLILFQGYAYADDGDDTTNAIFNVKNIVSHFLRSVDIQNTRSFSMSPINASNVGTLQKGWVYLTTPDTGSINTSLGSISSTPAVKGKYLYFNDYSGNITKLNRFTGAPSWVVNYVQQVSLPGDTDHMGIIESRNTPYVTGNMVIVGSNYALANSAAICSIVGGTPGAAPGANGCHYGDGAIVVALNKQTGAVIWKVNVDSHPTSKITGSITGSGNTIFVPVGNWEEEFARSSLNIFGSPIINDAHGNPTLTTGPIDPASTYPCCSARGSLVAMDVTTAKVLWKTFITPGTAVTQQNPDTLYVDNNPPVDQVLLPLLAGRAAENPPVSGLYPPNYVPANPGGFFGSSVYGHNPTVDTKRNLVYIATAQNTVAPKAAEDCEKARRGQIPVSQTIDGQNITDSSGAKVTCANLNDKLHNYASSVLALDTSTGKIKWVYHSRRYDAWNHAAAAPDFYGIGSVLPFVFPTPIANAQNAFQDPIGPDEGFGQEPMLLKSVKMPNGSNQDLVVVGNKDGRLFALNPDTGVPVWGAPTNTDPGGIYGGLQFGRATDGKTIYFGTFNTQNINRDVNKPFVAATDFLQCNGFTNLLNNPAYTNPANPNQYYGAGLCSGFSTLGANQIRVGLYSQGDKLPLVPMPGPSSLVLPFPGPAFTLSNGAGYPISYPLTVGSLPPTNPINPYMTGPASGPKGLWTLINPPADINSLVDGKTVFLNGGSYQTINGMVEAVDAATGKILWQRPANDSIVGTLATANVHGTLTVGNGVVFVGYNDAKGTIIGLDAATGKRLFLHQSLVCSSTATPAGLIPPGAPECVNGDGVPAGSIESGPQIVGRRLYWGIGNETLAPFPNSNFKILNGGNRLYQFVLPGCFDDLGDFIDRFTNFND